MTVKSITYSFSHLRLSLVILAIVAIGLGLASFQTPTKANPSQGREVRVEGATALVGKDVGVSVRLESQGNENAIGFSLNFNTAIFSISSVSLGSDAAAAGAVLNFNPDQSSGQVGVIIGLSPGQVFTAGTRQIAIVSFTVKADAPTGVTPLTFGDSPVARAVADASANTLPTAFTQGNITVTNPAPVLTDLNPNAKNAGDAAFTLTLNGRDFINASEVRWNGDRRPTSFVSTTRLLAQIPAADLATAGIASVTVFSPGSGGGESSPRTFTINNQGPSITTVAPNSATVGSPDVAITVTGTSFTNTSIVRLNGADLTTTFTSATQLSATIQASRLTTAGVANIAVFTPAPGGGTSNSVTFSINNQVPVITTLSPALAIAGAQAFTLTVNGSGFVMSSTVQWNGSNRVTTFVSATRLTAAITAADIAVAGAANVTVVTPAPGGGTSNAAPFTILPVTTPNPTITTLNPGFAIVGGPQFTLTVNGTGFVNGSIVRWNDSDRPTSFVSATQLTAMIPATDIAAQGTANVKVFNAIPGGGTSNTVPFFIGAQLTSVSAASYRGNELADASIIAGFGVNLATQTQTAPSQPLPTTLGGTNIRIRDSAGVERLAPLFYASPLQLNYQVTPGTADGLATVVATSSDNKLSVGALPVLRVAPGVFSANSDGVGVAAAFILRVKPDNSQVNETILRFDSAQGKFVSIPVDMGPETDQVFLVIFGTGIRFSTSMAAVSASIGGTNLQVTYANLAPGFTGLDQVNIRLQRSLIGRGEMDVILTVNGKVANMVRLNIK